jgi:hypothetical protein
MGRELFFLSLLSHVHLTIANMGNEMKSLLANEVACVDS